MNNDIFQTVTLNNLNRLNFQLGEIKGEMMAYHKDSKSLNSSWKKAKILIPVSGIIPSIIAVIALI